MDVVLTPVGTDGHTWCLTDRLRRPLGMVKKFDGFTIMPAQGSNLWRIHNQHPTLDAVMTAIAQHTHGACSLDSGERDEGVTALLPTVITPFRASSGAMAKNSIAKPPSSIIDAAL